MVSTNIDEIDRRILRQLQNNGRLSSQELSERVGLSPSPCSRRIKILEKNGVICGYSALIDEEKLGYGVSVFVSVRLDRQIDDALKKFEAKIRSYPEVVDCWLMTGNRDYLLRISTKDLIEFEEFLTSRLTKISSVASIESSIPLRRVKWALARTI
jgi:Lrp/AsnC family transcriptional regulator, leucine-responsive regulatory protein